MNFKSRIELIDTGQRRYPNDGEVYCWHNDGKVSGPFMHFNDTIQDEVIKFMSEPENYAIYAVLDNEHYH